jgi:hypothetical protein
VVIGDEDAEVAHLNGFASHPLAAAQGHNYCSATSNSVHVDNVLAAFALIRASLYFLTCCVPKIRREIRRL